MIEGLAEPNPQSVLSTLTAIMLLRYVSLSLNSHFTKHSLQALDPSFESIVTARIIAKLADWKRDFCILYYAVIEDEYLTISNRHSELLQNNKIKRKKVYLEPLGLIPFKPRTRNEVTVSCLSFLVFLQ